MEQNHTFYCMTRNPQRHLDHARQRCKEISAELPIIKSQSENDFIHNLMKKRTRRWQRVWLGMRRNQSGFFWFDGSPAEPSDGEVYSAWRENELNSNLQGKENCAFLDLGSKKWIDYKCNRVNNGYVICQKRA